MDNSIYALLSGQVALRRKMDVVANNMANLNTTGFKQEKLHFDSVYKSLETDGKGVDFVQDTYSTTNFTSGGLSQTGNMLDVAVSDNALLSVQDNNGNTFYTKDGRLSINAEGSLVLTANGMKVLDNGSAEIQLPPEVDNISIAGDGTISTNEGPIARIGMYGFEPQNIDRLADGLFKSAEPLEATQMGKMSQGFLEGSNVNAVKTLTEMIAVQRAYESSSNLISKEDNRIKEAIQRIGRSPR